MLSMKNDDKIEALAWQIMIVSVFRTSKRQTLNLLFTLVGASTPEESNLLLNHIFQLVRKGVIYVPEARLEIFQTSPEAVDVYLIKDFDETMKEFTQELNELRLELDNLKNIGRIPTKVLIDLKNLKEGKYIESIH